MAIATLVVHAATAPASANAATAPPVAITPAATSSDGSARAAAGAVPPVPRAAQVEPVFDAVNAIAADTVPPIIGTAAATLAAGVAVAAANAAFVEANTRTGRLPASTDTAAPIRVTDDRGATLVFAAPPQRIVSLLPSLTESVCALGGCAWLVGTDRFSDWPASVGALPKLGGLDDAQIERIVALRPEVVLASTSARVVDRLEALGIRVLVFDSQSHADVQRSLALIGRLLGTPQRADELWARIEREMQQAALRVPARLRGQQVYFEVDAAPHAAGAGSFVGQTLARIGLGNAVPAALGPFPKLNPEFVVRAQPQIVMAAQRNLAEMPRRPGWATLHALREHRTCGFDGPRYALLVRPGPRLGEAAAVLADCLAALPASE